MPIKKYLYSILSCIVIIMAMLFIGSYKFVDGFRDIPRTQPIVNVETTQAKKVLSTKVMDSSMNQTPVMTPVTGPVAGPISSTTPISNTTPISSTTPISTPVTNPAVSEKDVAALQAQITRLQAQLNAITTK